MAKHAINLRKQPAPEVATPRRHLPGFQGHVPMPTAGLGLTPADEVILKAHGWKPGDPVPDLTSLGLTPEKAEQAAREILEAQQAAIEEASNAGPPVSPDTPPLGELKIVPVNSLPLEKQQELVASLALAKQQAAHYKQVQRETEGMSPQFAAGFREAVAQDVREDMQAMGQGARPFGTVKPGTPMTELPENVRLKGRPPQPKPAPEPEPPLQAGASLQSGLCQHCGHSLSEPATVQANDEDKLQYVHAVLSGARFYKDYPLLDGQLLLRFRSLSSEEANQVWAQLTTDVQQGRLVGNDAFLARMQRYRLACSLDSIRTFPKDSIEMPLFSEVDYDPKDLGPGETILPALIDQIERDILTSDSLRRLAVVNLSRFQRLVEHLEAHADDENFWQAGPAT